MAVPYLSAAANFDHPPSLYYMGIFKFNGYGMEINYHQALNWFERAASFDDDRVSKDAARYVRELQALLDQATETNNRIIELFQSQSESY